MVQVTANAKNGGEHGGGGPFSHQRDIPVPSIKEWQEQAFKDPKNRLALAALANQDVHKTLISRSVTLDQTQKFNVKIPLEGSPMTAQHASGRCWIFAACNVFRVAFMKKYNLKEFELSQSYLFFWDKLEKANYFLEQVLETAHEELDGRLLQTLLAAPVQDGGQWDMLANLVHKYGLIPKTLYPDTWNSKNSRIINNLITTKLRENALILRKLALEKSEKIGETKAKMVQEIHLVLSLALGPPPDPRHVFTWEYTDKEDKLHEVKTSPLDFAKLLSETNEEGIKGGADPMDMFSLVNDPRNKYLSLLSVSRLGNVFSARPVTYVNVEMSTIKKVAINMLKAGHPIFFGSDVGKSSDRHTGIMDPELFDYELGFNIKLGMNKAQRLETGGSQMTHAMVLTAVHLVDDKPVRWRVENSWGTDPGVQGWFVASDAWMDEYTYQIVVDPSFVDSSITDVLKQEAKVLPLWDPMGALA